MLPFLAFMQRETSEEVSIHLILTEARRKRTHFSPMGRAWLMASSEGLLIYSVYETVQFDPINSPQTSHPIRPRRPL
jgi:hypothetical protein